MKDPTLRPELLDELLGGAKTQDEIFGPGGVLKRLTAAVIERALNAELGVHLHDEAVRAPDGVPSNRRNGSSFKRLQTDHGPVPVDVPRDRKSTFEPILVPKHQTRIAALDTKILALYARGMSVRDIQEHLAELYGTTVSPQLISTVTEAVHDEILAWQNRPLERAYAVVWLDALVLKVREQGTVQNKAAYLAIGLTLEGHREVLGLWLESTEGAKFWLRVMTELRNRGLHDILIACCDGLKGFPQAIEASFPQAIVQTCIVHQVRYSLSFVSYRDRRDVVADLRAVYQAENDAIAKKALDDFDAKWSSRYPTIVSSWQNNWERLAPFLSLPREIRRMVYTTNAIESLNFRVRKLLKTKGHFPNDDAAIKLIYLALRSVEAKWRRAPRPTWRQIYNQLVIFFGERAMVKT